MFTLTLAFVILVASQSLIPRTLFVVLLAALFMGWVVMLTWAAFVIPPAAIKGFFEANYHPDTNVRALQRGEITIEEYVRRKGDTASTSNALPTSSRHTSDAQRKA
ncbi:hypothetical protein J2W49_004673 [Hydrogenophaga palleronii]|uniref:SHOCT domain-containing protein n=1 Tax=Hydrogenophaga palleronii TaxID=65655 RepID=A0ABU1WTS8_9BURK|nr:hypothetical protein [Hydrogenophaga palleronii]MDR7152695.1 hypothetical protein [Hydrogenophaga palleronii]